MVGLPMPSSLKSCTSLFTERVQNSMKNKMLFYCLSGRGGTYTTYLCQIELVFKQTSIHHSSLSFMHCKIIIIYIPPPINSLQHIPFRVHHCSQGVIPRSNNAATIVYRQFAYQDHTVTNTLTNRPHYYIPMPPWEQSR